MDSLKIVVYLAWIMGMLLRIYNNDAVDVES
jgi:hypothetical protein